jgi:predicted RND superfamily exporter protein
MSITLRLGTLKVMSQVETVKQIKGILKNTSPPPEVKNIYHTGISFIMLDTMHYVKSDFKNLLWLTPILITLFLFVTLRKWRLVIVPLLVIKLSMVWLFSFYFAAGCSIDMTTSMLPTIMMVICLSDIVHMITHYKELARTSDDRTHVIAKTMQHMIPTCFMTSLTTVIGFAVFTLAEIPALRGFGLWSSVGIIISYILAIIIVPIALSFIPMTVTTDADGNKPSTILDTILNFFIHLIHHDRYKIAVITLVAVILAGWGISRINIETFMLKNLPDKADSVRGAEFIQTYFSGSSSFEILVFGKEDEFQSLASLKEIDALQAFIEDQDYVGTTFSLTTVLKSYNKRRRRATVNAICIGHGIHNRTIRHRRFRGRPHYGTTRRRRFCTTG